MSKRKPQSSPDNYRDKGPMFETMVKHAVQWAFPGARIYRGAQAVEGGAGEADVETPILHVEAKWRRKTDLRASYRQAREDADPGKLVMVACLDDPDKSGEAEAMCMMSLADMLTLLHAVWEGWGGAEWAKDFNADNHRPPPASVFWDAVGKGGRRGSLEDSGESEAEQDGEAEGDDDGDRHDASALH